ncbi:GntP family permease [Priestia endophytica]|uniref:GntP family permease n=1 Tax=Priestia endophytica TaxID=135735 RepID=UPI002280109E|nr:GntP family permease [Priestia endophytica]MCY8231777.1 GntP family permease [Priestia endophytica]
MDVVIILFSLGLLMFMAYRGYSVILFAPIAALLAVALTNPTYVLPFFSEVFMVKMVDFIKQYFPVFLLGAVFGKVVEMSGLARIIAQTIISLVGAKRAILATVLLGAILTYSGVSLFVVVFAVYPFANNMFREANIPKRLLPAAIALGAVTFTMDALPGTPQIQNVIPTTFFKTDIYAAPILGFIGTAFVLFTTLFYLEWRRKQAAKRGEGYSGSLTEEQLAASSELAKEESKVSVESVTTARKILAFVPLVLVGVSNKFFTEMIPKWYSGGFDFSKIGLPTYNEVDLSKVTGIWSVEIALALGIIATIALNWTPVVQNMKKGLTEGISGSLLAVMNTASEYGFGAVIAALPGFLVIRDGISQAFTNPLVNSAVTTNVLAGVTGSASGGMSIVLGVMGEKYYQVAQAANIDLEVMHRVISMASGGMDTLPHNGAIITLLAVTGMTHKQSYGDIFVITVVKTLAAFLIIAVYMLTGLV